MNFNENRLAYIIVENLSIQRDDGHFCDAVITVQGEKFKAHRNVLAAGSKYFLSLFKSKKSLKEKVTLTRCKNVDAFRSLLNYMYTGVIAIDSSNVSDLMALAEKFVVDKIMGYCEVYLRDHINSANCFFSRDLAIKYKLVGLENDSVQFITNHIAEILEKEEIIRFSPRKLRLFLKEKDCHFPQQELLNFFCRWVDFDQEKREKCFQEMLGFINWQAINPAALEEYITGCELLKKNQSCLYVLLSVLEENNIKLREHDEKFAILKKELDSLSSNTAVDNSPADGETLPEVQDLEEAQADFDIIIPNVIPPETMTSKKTSKKLNGSSTKSTENELEKPKNKRSRKSTHPQKVIPIPRRGRRKNLRQNIANDSPVYQIDEGEASDNDDDYHDADYNSGTSSAENESEKRKPMTRSRKRTRTQLIKLSRQELKEMTALKCESCSYATHSTKSMQNHIAKSHSLDVTYKCKDCDFVCKWSRDYHNHLRTHYNGPPFKCTDCDYETENMERFGFHLFRHGDSRPFVCEQCKHSCKSRSVLIQHIMIQHTGEKPFPCTVCEKRFITKYFLSQHMLSHFNDSQFLCDTCGYAAKSKRRLNIHMRRHTGRVFRCDFPGCLFSGPFKSVLTRHQRTHSEARPFICSFCGSSFRDKKHLIPHERIHLNGNPHKCDQCEYSSPQHSRLLRHKQKYHSDESTKGAFRPRKKRLFRLHDEEPPPPPRRSVPAVQPPDLGSNTSVNTNKSSNQSRPNVISSLNSSENRISGGYNPPPVCFSHSSMGPQQSIYPYQAACNQGSSLQHTGQNPSFGVPAMSHEIPTKFRTYMQFL